MHLVRLQVTTCSIRSCTKYPPLIHLTPLKLQHSKLMVHGSCFEAKRFSPGLSHAQLGIILVHLYPVLSTPGIRYNFNFLFPPHVKAPTDASSWSFTLESFSSARMRIWSTSLWWTAGVGTPSNDLWNQELHRTTIYYYPRLHLLAIRMPLDWAKWLASKLPGEKLGRLFQDALASYWRVQGQVTEGGQDAWHRHRHSISLRNLGFTVHWFNLVYMFLLLSS